MTNTVEHEEEHLDWKDHHARLEYEEKQSMYRKWRWNWSCWDKFTWIFTMVIVEGFFVVLLYGGSAYIIYEQALADKAEAEEQMKEDWLAENSNASNDSMPVFDYYEFENHFMIHYFKYCTIACQGQAFFLGILFQFIDYRKFAFMITFMYGICLPVDTLIFYKGFTIDKQVRKVEFTLIHIYSPSLVW